MNAAAGKSASVKPARYAGVEASNASPMKASQTAAMEAAASHSTTEPVGDPTPVETATAHTCVEAATAAAVEPAAPASSMETPSSSTAASMRGVGEIRRRERHDA